MSHRQIMFVIYALMAGMFLSSLYQTIVGTAIRTIGDDLQGLDKQAWVTTSYLITSTISVPIYGKLSDLFGRRPLFIVGIVIFTLGSLLAAFSTSMLMLAGFRAFQGIGAGALMALPLAIMGDILAPRERAKYQGYFFAIFGISTVIGPLVGGIFAGADQILGITGWRWVFLITVPIGLITLFMVLKFLHLPKMHRPETRIDWWGATAVILALVPLLLVAEEGREWGWASPLSIACYVVGIVSAVAFIVIEIRMGSAAIIPMSLFRSGAFSMATVIGVLVGFGMFGVMMTIPLYMQIAVGLNPTESGFAMVPMVAGLIASSLITGQLIARTGQYRIYPVTGTAMSALGFLMLTFISFDQALWYTLLGMFVFGLGLGQLMQTLVLASQNAVPATSMGVASSAATFFRQIGGTLGTAILLSVLFASLPMNVSQTMADESKLTAALTAALDPAVSEAPENAAIMAQLWRPITEPILAQVQAQLDEATQGVQGEAALETIAAEARASVIDGRVQVDWSDDAQRTHWVGLLVPEITATIAERSTAEGGADSTLTSDTSFLSGADDQLAAPFKIGFTNSIVTLYWIGFVTLLIAFILAIFFRVPPLRESSALQEQADAAGITATGTIRVQTGA